mgnify:CR=1 FL=1
MKVRRLTRWLLVVVLAVSGLAGCATLDTQQRKWIFQPTDRTWWGGAQAAEGMSDVWIEFASAQEQIPVKLHGLWLPQKRADAPLMLYLHGARWDVRSSAHRMQRMHELGFSVLGIDYRGFGKSTNTLPSEDLAHEDALAAWQWLAKQQPQAKRFVFGHSLGSAIAVRLSSEADDVTALATKHKVDAGDLTAWLDYLGIGAAAEAHLDYLKGRIEQSATPRTIAQRLATGESAVILVAAILAKFGIVRIGTSGSTP